MSAVIGSLRAELSANIAQFQSDMGRAADSLKGFSRAAKKISSEVSEIGKSMSIAITLPLVALGVESVKQANEATAAMAQLEAAIESTGNASGKTAEQLAKSAKELRNMSTFHDDEILRNLTTNLLTFDNVSGPIFDRAQEAIVNLSSRLGQDLQSATIKVGRALQDPIAGMKALSRLGVAFTAQQQDHIRVLVQSGQGAKAQGIILDELAAKFGGAAKAARAATPTADFQNAWEDFTETIGRDLVPVLKDLSEALKEMLDWFGTLTPATRQMVIETAALAAALGPVLTFFGSFIKILGKTIPLLYGFAVAQAAAFGPLTIIAGILVGLVTALGLLTLQSRKVSDAIDDEGDAHKTLTDLLDKAKKAGGKLSESDRDLARQKLELARATLEAAKAQVEQNLAIGQLQSGGLQDADSGFANIGTPDVASSQNALARINSAILRNTKDMQALNAEIKKPETAGTGRKGSGHAGEFSLGAEQIAATKAFQQSLDSMKTKIANSLGGVELPKATAQANALNSEIDNFVKKAQEAGVNTGTFTGRVIALRSQIEGLRQAGLQKEAQQFGEAVNADALAVDKFARGSLPPLAEKLQAVDDQFRQLRDKIENEISQNAVLADSNAEAADAMDRLKAALVALDIAHGKATKAAIAQYEAEKLLADLNTQRENLGTRFSIEDLRQARGEGGPISTAQQDLQSANRELAQQGIESQQKLADLQLQRAAAEAAGDADHLRNLDSQIALQQQLASLIAQTSGEQLVAAKNVNDAFKTFADSVSSDLSNMLATWNGDLADLGNTFKNLVRQLFLKPVTDKVAGAIGGALKGLATGNPGAGVASAFAGFFAGGGSLNPGEWGIAGENGPEPIFAGGSSLAVVPNQGGNASRGDIYVDARGADSAAVDRLAVVVKDLQKRERGRVLSYQADHNRRTRG